jgi:hypothetical protein
MDNNSLLVTITRGNMNQLSETQKAYLAGLIDGEGCVTILKHQGKNNRSPVYRAMLVVAMTSKETIEAIHTFTSVGTIHYEERNNKKETNCSVYRWQISVSTDLRGVLQAILPYLILKRGEVETVLEYLSLPSDPSMGKGIPKPLFYTHKREAYYQRLHDVKTRGKGITEDRPAPVIEPIYDAQMRFF